MSHDRPELLAGREIRGSSKTIRGLLTQTKYAIDLYQREYKWQTKHVSELLDDLAAKFLDSYHPEHERADVGRYGHYFLGSVIVSDKQGLKYIIDGQQRLTTLTLLLIYLYHLQAGLEHPVQVADLIFSERYGQRSFNMDVPERRAAMEALFKGQPFDESDQPESVRNIVGRYRDIEDIFADDLKGDALPFFVDWLTENVHLVEITAYCDEDAYTIFETMNDRGLSLSATDMLKGYLLANITDEERRGACNRLWRTVTAELAEMGKEEDADAIKSWLRSQYANSIRERKKNAVPLDFDRIGTEFHRWVRDNRAVLGLERSSDFAELIERNFAFYTRQYALIRQAAEQLDPDLECVYYNAEHNFTLQYPVLLAPLRPDDPAETVRRKIRVASRYLDILLHRRIWNYRAIDHSTMQYAMFLTMQKIRGMDVPDLLATLTARLTEDTETLFAANERFYLHGMNGRQIHRILARMTDYIGTQSGATSRYAEYANRSGSKGYEVEHIWANRPERHRDEFDHETDFRDYRNRIGGLLLLPKSFNASYGDKPYAEKVERYIQHDPLAKSLHAGFYESNPGFLRFVERSGLPFHPHPDFKRADLDERQWLYLMLAERIWDPARLEEAAE